jgi:hypothetical protein
MKWLLGRIGLPKAIGLYVDEETIVMSQVVATPLGRIEVLRRTEPVGAEGLAAALGRVLGPVMGKRRFRRPPVSLAVPSRRVYFSTRPVHASTGDSSAHVLLREAFCSQNITVGDMVVDVIKSQPDSREVAGIASCDKNYLGPMLDALQTLDIVPRRTEPAPCALLRLGAARRRERRGSKVVLRVFLSNRQILAILVANRMPLLWRVTPLAQGEEASAILSACRSLAATAKNCGVDSALEEVIIHGYAELQRLVDLEWIEEQLNVSVDWLKEPALDDAWIARGAAEAAVGSEEATFDLGRSMKPPPTLKQIFPWREAALQAFLLACVAAFLAYTSWTLRQSQGRIAAAPAGGAAVDKRKLQKEKEELESNIQALREFFDGRVLWTSCLRDLAARVPQDMYLTSIRGLCELENKQKKRGGAKAKKSLVLRGAIKVPPDGIVPREIDRLLVALRSDPTLKEDFPLITLDELQQVQAREGEVPTAIFSVVCLPREKKAGAGGQTPAGKAEAGKKGKDAK